MGNHLVYIRDYVKILYKQDVDIEYAEKLTNEYNNLIIKYVETNDYPIKLGVILGVPMFEYSDTINSHSELLGRIKQLGQILGVKTISFKTNDNKTVIFYMIGEYTIG